MVTGCSVPPVEASMMAPCDNGFKTRFLNYGKAAANAIDNYDRSLEILESFFMKDKEQQDHLTRNQYSRVVRTKDKRVRLIRPSLDAIKALVEQQVKENKEREQFLAGNYENKAYIGDIPHVDNTCTAEQVSFASPFYKRSEKKKRRARRIPKAPRLSVVLEAIMPIVRKKEIPIEFIGIGKKAHLRARYVHRSQRIIPKIELPHSMGVLKRREVVYKHQARWLEVLCRFGKYGGQILDDFSWGDSGLLFDERMSITCENTPLPYLIVRGRCRGRLINALHKVNNVSEIQHYSQSGELLFFKGWKEVFDKMVPHTHEHQCTIDFSNEQCGAAAALISQSVYPVHKLSCAKCRSRVTDLAWDEYKQFILTHMSCNTSAWDENPNASQLRYVKQLVQQVTSEHMSIDLSMEIVRLTQNYKNTHMLQIQDINKALMKGTSVTQEELRKALQQLLAMTQWWKNHMTLTDEDALKTFRNKRSSKALVNPNLLCDNQLDKNGNFIWGERGRHSKRFFSNFFDEVVPSNGYTDYVMRKHPNGQRKLAIGSLVVPLDLDRARLALQGESVERQELTMSCVSRQDGNFIYPCCCVTHDDGKVVFSELKSPTKRHLVVGTSGDPKYIDLPATDSDRMYIAKEGYCYLNIFLAMLINVNEEEAKDFTKMVRDVIVPRLGTWPTMMDLATAVYMLTVFHPETRNAELPRILVDHKCQTMHVIDSFGSLSVGYHILKAGTANQLIQFASNDLKSEMKHYRVGGTQQRTKCELALMSGIFKPKRMIMILQNDPYILLMGLISPTILIHMYRMKHLEKGIELWINREQSVAKIFVILEHLTKKIAVCDVLCDQLKVITESSGHLLRVLEDCPTSFHSYKPALDILTLYVEKEQSNKQLVENGFADIHDTLYIAREKIYSEQLQQEWHALSLLEKSYATWQLKKFSCSTEKFLTRRALREKGESSGRFVSACFMNAQTHLRSSVHTTLEKCSDMWYACVRKLLGLLFSTIQKCYSDIVYLVNVVLLFSILVQMVSAMHGIIQSARREKVLLHKIKQEENENTIVNIYKICRQDNKTEPTVTDFLNTIGAMRPDLLDTALQMVKHEENVELQGKNHTQLQFEKIIAVMALLTMCFDNERSDAIFKILHRLKTVFSTMGEEVKVQSLDDVSNIEDDKKLTVDFDIETSKEPSSLTCDVRFEDWWNKQLQQNRVVPHYRSTGEFMEFTRETAAKVAYQISTSSATEFLVRGAVGSGKSTGLPHHLSKKGKVLLLEPTRPLAENVCKQLAGDPFFHSATLRMRGLSKFGSSNITIMTSGFAFHYYVNNPQQLGDFEFIIIDECHALDSATIAFNCALKEFEYPGKLLKVSATPPGRECEFTTQHTVKLKVEEHISFQQFVNAQGTGANADMIQYGHNILVYVASYNEVDQLSKLLVEKQFKVSKVDGRTMQVGNVEILTSGTESKPHFVVATNIIENGVTLDVDCVVDFGLKVVASLDCDSRCVRYNKVPITYGERIQRLGRVGRCKPGFALRIGHTEKGIEEIPEFIATEAAFLSFAYGLPVTTQNVSTNILSKCTVKQARSALNFELTPFFTTHFIRYDGCMHPEVHKILKAYKLRESEMMLNKAAIPFQYTSQWITVKEYDRMGVHLNCDDATRIPFYIHGIPDKIFEALWNVVCKFKGDAGFGRISSVNATKISYTLSTDPSAIPRTIAIIDHLLSEEMMKRNHFDTIGSAITGYSFSLAGITDGFRKRYLRDYTQQNIATLQQARAQLLEFNSSYVDVNNAHNLEEIGVLHTVQLQSKHEVSKFLGLKGKWNGEKFMNDIFLVILMLIGGGWMLWEYFIKKMKEPVTTQGKKRMMQKLKFRDAYDRKLGREIYANDGTMEHTFGEAYTAKGKQKGSTHTKGMGRKTRNFTHMYGVEPENYSMIRFVDPLTGHTMDENPRVDIRLVQEEFGNIRKELIENDQLDVQMVRRNPGVQAYFLGTGAQEALKVDLTPHIPTLLCINSNTISGFPEREGELRQTGLPVKVPSDAVPKPNEVVGVESKSVYKGLRDYSGIATLICQIVNASEGHNETIFGIGYGSYIITNGHLFRRNNGTLTVRTWHGDFIVHNSTQIKIHFIEGKDAIIIRMPKDFPPFAKRSFFRAPIKEERVCMVGTNFQEKSLRATVSESSMIIPEGRGSFWVHWITTQDGYCGLPLVSVSDGFIVGFHGLTSNETEKNFFVPFSANFESEFLQRVDELEWNKHWLWQPDKIAWGSLSLVDEQPKEDFKISKLITDLFSDPVLVQSKKERWVLDAVCGNLRACGAADSALVTKHVVKGKCHYFEQYLQENQHAHEFFSPLCGSYQPSRLNREAFKKDFFKYNKPVIINEVDFDVFSEAVEGVKAMMSIKGFVECVFVTDTNEILDSLNLKAAVGAQYRGKKSEYLQAATDEEKDRLLFLSCERLFYGKKGLWNGSLKAELRPLEKVKANKTRTFTAAPIDTLLGAKTCVDDFNNQFYSLHLECPWTVGMTKFYGGWDRLMRKLPENWIYCHADGSQFDSSLTPLLLNSVLDIRMHFMEKWWVGQEMLMNLYAEIVYTPILTPDGTVFKKFRGNNSGQPSTVVDNTLMVVIALYYSCMKQGLSLQDIMNRVIFFANGDDIILAVQESDEWLYDKLGVLFAQLGLNYDFSERTRHREELWFMSHQAKLVNGIYIPKLEPERIVSILEWDRSKELMHRTEAICAAMIEAWGHTELLTEIRKFYLWLLQKDEFKELAKEGKTPYIAETALRNLYINKSASMEELRSYIGKFSFDINLHEHELVSLQSSTVEQSAVDAGADKQKKDKDGGSKDKALVASGAKDKDVGASSKGQTIPRLHKITKKMNLPTVKGKVILSIDHLIEYKPTQTDLFNTRATKSQFESWYNAIQREYEISDEQMSVIMNGFMVWCIDNGTSPDINGVWVMMDGDEQVEYPLKPMVENAKPTLRQIMHHFSDAAEAYIEMRNSEGLYMPRYGLLRNLRDRSLARYAFDFYEVNSKTSDRAREAVAQMKAAALVNVNNKLFGLDGNISTISENTERHTARDVNQNMHTLLGVNSLQ